MIPGMYDADPLAIGRQGRACFEDVKNGFKITSYIHFQRLLFSEFKVYPETVVLTEQEPATFGEVS
jgi:hypothetical protein